MTTAFFTLHTSGSDVFRTRFCMTQHTDQDVCATIRQALVRRLRVAFGRCDHRSVTPDFHRRTILAWPVPPAICRQEHAAPLFLTDRSPSYWRGVWRGFRGKSRNGKIRWLDKSPHIAGRVGRGFSMSYKTQTQGAAFLHTSHVFIFINFFKVLRRCQGFYHEC